MKKALIIRNATDNLEKLKKSEKKKLCNFTPLKYLTNTEALRTGLHCLPMSQKIDAIINLFGKFITTYGTAESWVPHFDTVLTLSQENLFWELSTRNRLFKISDIVS